MTKIAIFVANKSEDIEVVVPLDIWRRAGFIVKLISIEKKKNLVLSHGTKIACDEILANENISKYNAIYLPGGVGHLKFNDTDAQRLINFLKKEGKNKKITFMAMCAAVEVFGGLGLLTNTKATCYPSYQKTFESTYVDKDVVVDKNFITGKAPGATISFALSAVAHISNKKQLAKQIANDIFYSGKIN